MLTILLVDDNPDDILMIKRSLEKGFDNLSIRAVSNSKELAAAIVAGGFDLVITDYYLGFTNGLKVLAQVKTEYTDCPVVMFTLTGNEEVAVEAMKSGVEDYILKTPQHLAQLTATVNRILMHQNERKALKNTRVALQESESRYRSMFHSEHALMLLIHPEMGTIVDANPAACIFYGYTLSEFTNLRLSDISLSSPLAIERKIQGILAEEISFLQLQHRLKNGQIKDIEIYTGPITVDGQELIYNIIHDVTERRRAEAQIKLQAVVLEAAANAIVIVNRQGTIQWANPAFTTLTGYALSEVNGQNLRLLDSDQQPNSFYNQMWKDILAGQVWHGQLKNRRKDGRDYVEEMTITPVRDDNQEISHFVAIKQDVTEAFEYHRELELIEKVAWRLRDTDDIQSVTQDLLEETLFAFETTSGSIILFDAEKYGAVISSSRGWLQDLPKATNLPTQSIATLVMKNAKTYLIPDVRNDPNISQESREFIPEGWAGVTVPIRTGTEVLGVLNLAVPHPRVISAREAAMLERATEIAANALRRRALRQQVEGKYRQLTLLRDIDLAITNSLDLDSVLEFFLKECVGQLGIDAAAVALYQPATNTLEYTALNGFHNIPEHRQIQIGEEFTGLAALDRHVLHIADLNDEVLVPPSWKLENFVSCWAIPLWSKSGLQGVLELFTRSKPNFGSDWQEFLQSLAVQAAIAIENSKLYTDLQIANQDLEAAYDATIQALSLAIDLRDHETEGHSQRVTKLSVELAKHLNLPEVDIIQIRRGALLHDIGKLGVPDSVLLKPGKLDAHEWVLMKKHPVLAHEWLSKIPFLRAALEIPYAHHERWDGTGYPLGLKAEEIPLAARIFAVADVYDALTSDRPYRVAWSHQKTLDHLQENSGTHFDKTIIQVFENIMKNMIV